MIFGIYQKAPPMVDILTLNGAAWLGSEVHLVRYEELIQHLRAIEGQEAEQFFDTLLRACGIDKIPEDWRERVRVGSDRKQSATARENLTGSGAE